ncbi:MAG: hypothetical protein ACREEL_10165 [Stellaceae bacterium]
MRLDAHERWILDHVEHFVACAFGGRGRYERVSCPDLAAAHEASRRLVRDRPVAIYAISGLGQALVEVAETLVCVPQAAGRGTTI